MKNLILLLLAIPFFANAQIISKSDLDITEVGARKLKKVPKKIYIKEFNVGYQYLEDASTTSTNNDNSKETVSIAAVLNAGLTTADIQSITDKAYQKFSKRLKDAGFELVEEDVASRIPYFQSGKVTKAIGGKPMDAGGYIYTLATGTTRIDKVTDVDNAISKTKKTIGSLSKGLGSLSGIADIGKKSTYVNVNEQISQELGIPILEFGMNFSFLNLTKSGGGGLSVLKGTTGLEAAIYKGILVNKGDGKFGNVESLVQVVSKSNNPVEIEGVIEKKKVSKMADAKNAKGYAFGVEYRQNKTIKQTKLVDADKATYIAKVSQALDEYLDFLATSVVESFN